MMRNPCKLPTDTRKVRPSQNVELPWVLIIELGASSGAPEIAVFGRRHRLFSARLPEINRFSGRR